MEVEGHHGVITGVRGDVGLLCRAGTGVSWWPGGSGVSTLQSVTRAPHSGGREPGWRPAVAAWVFLTAVSEVLIRPGLCTLSSQSCL